MLRILASAFVFLLLAKASASVMTDHSSPTPPAMDRMVSEPIAAVIELLSTEERKRRMSAFPGRQLGSGD